MAELTARFFSLMFSLLVSSEKIIPESLSDWLTTEIIEICVLGSPYCVGEAVALTKSSLRIIKVLLPHASLSWVGWALRFTLT